MPEHDLVPPFRILDAHGCAGKPIGDIGQLLGALRNFQGNRHILVNGRYEPNPIYPASLTKMLLRRNSWSPYYIFPFHRAYGVDFVVVDDLGAIIPFHRLLDLWKQHFGYYDYLRRGRDDFTFRRGPVPYTASAKWRKGGCSHCPKTTQERRAALAVEVEEDVGVRVRGKRSFSSLPSTYDDRYRRTENNWKRHRRTQYRE